MPVYTPRGLEHRVTARLDDDVRCADRLAAASHLREPLQVRLAGVCEVVDAEVDGRGVPAGVRFAGTWTQMARITLEDPFTCQRAVNEDFIE